MKIHDRKITRYIIPIIIFFFAFFLRQYFFTGFILGDDIQEFDTQQYILANGPDFHDAFYLRFGVWIFNVLSFKLFGISEFSFFLPTWLMSSTLGVIGYFILIFWKYPREHAFLAGLFIASAPFEILIGTIRANDLIFSWVLALGLLFFIYLKKKQTLQGIITAFILWFAFYTKLWAVYFIPALIFYYIFQGIRKKNWRGGTSFLITSLILHSITSIFWKIKMGSFFPFISYHAATYPVPTEELLALFQEYPKMIFVGSEFKTTFFGYVPYLLLLLLAAKIILSRVKKFSRHLRYDKLDVYLVVFYISFFLLLNFFPNTFTFDQYYSAPRIFRYLAPISFPMTLHLAKLILDFSKTVFTSNSSIKKYGPILVFLLLIPINIYQADEATKPGQIYRAALFSVVKDVKEQSPPQIIVETWLSFFLREVYLKDWKNQIVTIPNYTFGVAEEYEKWLKNVEPTLPDGTVMITGLGNYLHYGCHYCGFRLRQFSSSLNSSWQLLKEYETLNYLPIPEPTRLWRWNG